jgi:hypothetical protein
MSPAACGSVAGLRPRAPDQDNPLGGPRIGQTLGPVAAARFVPAIPPLSGTSSSSSAGLFTHMSRFAGAFAPTWVFETLRRAFLPYDQRALFYFLLRHQYKFAKLNVAPFGSYFEFGVGSGDSLVAFLLALRDFSRTDGFKPRDFRVSAFDTFAGLPEKSSSKDDSREWGPGKFAYSLDQVKRRVATAGLTSLPGELRFVEGNFEKTLTPGLRENLVSSVERAPAIVNIDVDYYSSTKTVLEWLRPVLRTGTHVFFDDYWSFSGNPHYGQLAAIEEFNGVGDGLLRNNPSLAPSGLVSNLFVFSKKEFEYR